jgi:hypothetical protein
MMTEQEVEWLARTPATKLDLLALYDAFIAIKLAGTAVSSAPIRERLGERLMVSNPKRT